MFYPAITYQLCVMKHIFDCFVEVTLDKLTAKWLKVNVIVNFCGL